MKSANYRLTKLTTVFSAQASSTVSANISTKHYDMIIIQVATAAATDGTFKIRGSVDSSAVLATDQSTTNIWDHVHSYNLDTPASGVNGNTGYSLGASAYAQIKVNVNTMKVIALEIASMTAGAYTAKVYGVNQYGT